MPADHRDHSAAALEVPFEHHARQTLRRAVIYYGMDHPVVDAALQSLLEIRQVAGFQDGVPLAPAAGLAAMP